MKDWYSMKDAAEFLEVSEETVKDWQNKSKPDPSGFCNYITRIGKRPIISRQNMLNFLNGLEPLSRINTPQPQNKRRRKKPVHHRNSLTQDELTQLLDYAPDSGLFRWKIDRGTVRKGDAAGTFYEGRGIKIAINNYNYLGHRLAWLYVTGKWPKHGISHLDRDKKNNAFKNLKESV